MQIETWAAHPKHWSIHFKHAGRITWAAHGYNRRSDAVRAAEDHAIGIYALVHGFSLKEVAAEDKRYIRLTIRSRVNDLPLE